MNQIVINGNNIDILKNYPDNYFDAVVTDPPYGLGKEPNAAELMKDWVEFGYHEVKGTGFMGKEWDAFVPQPVFWKEVFRVLKHGGHVLSFFGTRTYDWGVMSMRFAGFEVRDCIQWLYGSGFPKSYNIAKGIEGKIVNGSSSWNDWKKLDGEKEQVNWGYSKGQAEQGYREDYTEANKERVGKVNFQSEQAKQWDGWGTALKPANEPIVLARKPLEKGLSVAENILKWGVGGINIDASRIGTNGEKWSVPMWKSGVVNPKTPNFVSERIDVMHETNPQGRFPANIILTHHPDCVCKGTKKVKPSNGSGKASGTNNKFNKGVFQDENREGKFIEGGFTDADGNETVENWDCHEDCPIRILDEQSGISQSLSTKIGFTNPIEDNSFFYGMRNKVTVRHNDKGGASRFFYVAKASKSERNRGLDGFEEKERPDNYIMPKLTCSECGSKRIDSSSILVCGCNGKTHYEEQNSSESKNNLAGGNKNFHPTVKPIKLMQYLVKMVTPPKGKVLDPFCGSGTTGIACKIEGFDFVGIEQDAEYFKIAKARIKNYTGDNNEYQEDTPEPETPTINNEDKSQLTLF